MWPMARQFVGDRGLQPRRGAPGRRPGHRACRAESFDLVHARLLLVNIPSPEQVVAEMVRLVKPGGWVVTDEADAESAGLLSAPRGLGPAGGHLPCRLPLRRRRPVDRPEADRAAAGRRAGRGRRRSPSRRLPRWAPAAHHPPRPGAQHAATRLSSGASRSQDELARLDRAVREHLAKPVTLTMSSLYFLAWGKKPVE